MRHISAHVRPAEAMARIFGTVKPLPDLAPFWNVAQPTRAQQLCALTRSQAIATSIC